jgi:hypothetical protein
MQRLRKRRLYASFSVVKSFSRTAKPTRYVPEQESEPLTLTPDYVDTPTYQQGGAERSTLISVRQRIARESPPWAPA